MVWRSIRCSAWPYHVSRSGSTYMDRESPASGSLHGVLRCARTRAAFTTGQLAAPRIYATITRGISGAAGTKTFSSSGSSFTPRITDAVGTVTTYESPAIGSLLHVTARAGKEEFARGVGVVSDTTLDVDVIGREDGLWDASLAATGTAIIIEPVVAPYDASSDTLRPFGYAVEAVDAGEYGFFGAVGQFPCKPTYDKVGSRLAPSPIAGKVEPATSKYDCGVLLYAPIGVAECGVVCCDFLPGVQGNYYF